MWNITRTELSRLWQAIWPGWWLLLIATVWAGAAQEPPGLRSFGFNLTDPALLSGITGCWLLATCLSSSGASPSTESALLRAQPRPAQVFAAEWLATFSYGLGAIGLLLLCTAPIASLRLEVIALMGLHGLVLTGCAPFIRRVAVPDFLRPLLAIATALAYLNWFALTPESALQPASAFPHTAFAWTHIAPAPCFILIAWLCAHLSFRRRAPNP